MLRNIIGSIKAVVFGMLAAGVIFPATATADQWFAVGNTHGCVTYNSVARKIGNTAYSRSKTDCRWAAKRNEIRYAETDAGLFWQRASGGNWSRQASGRQRGSLFSQVTLRAACLNNNYHVHRTISHAYVGLKYNHTTAQTRNMETWRTRRTLNCGTH